ncbi:TraR/DksA family transcriptional regulator [Sphingomonas alba]|uniref:TraR/DksA C4-type zinc finger protein n=1 Tax=Sphingomonas alba TaxID=2908208 RepID=A0ABT0RP98_9SPHN|nr:TraR/DksA C4-type zinc finger protein [Sphingomonas alba]MCL6684482.1 TraR/DksA C4-type zinc finger protein [Sphingomonas alba]
MKPDAMSQLESLLVELNSRRARLAADLAEPLSRDSDEAAIEVEDDDALDAERRLVDQEIAAVKQALQRMADGSYGTCIRCRSPISAARLAAKPETSLCIECANQESRR